MSEAAEVTPTPNPFAPLSQTERARAQTIRLAVPPDDWTPQVPAPKGMAPPVSPQFWQMGQASRSWVYHTEEGEIAFAVYRFNYQNDKGEPAKDTIPMTYGTKNGRVGWHWKAPPTPSNLYRLPELITDTAKTVLVVEGEKTADAAALLFPDMAVVTWQGGGNAVQKANWLGLTERTVLIWPDNDKAGRKAAERVGRIAQEVSAADVRIVPVPETWPEAWDLADPLPGDATIDTLHALLAEAEPATQSAELPGRYSMNGKGVWFHPPASRQNDGQPEAVFISAPFEIVAETKDETGGSWGLLLRWQDRDKQEHQWAMPRKLLHADGNAIASELEDAGLSVATGKHQHNLLKSLLSQIETPQRMRCVNRSGWHRMKRGMVFVLPGGETYGPGSSNVILQSEKAIGGGADLQTRGTLKEWQDHVGRLAIKNDRVALFIASALAAPMLYIATEPSGGIHLFGKSQDGKTTTLAVASSVWGRGDSSGQIRSWRATANGFEGIASETCDALLPLDEIGQADAREVGEVVYMLSNEAGKGRAARDGSARARRTWRTLFLSTGEVPLATKMQEKGNKPMAGQDIRLVSLPANAGGKHGVFQELHGHKSAVAFATHLREASRTYYGTAARAFLSALTWALATDADGLTAFLTEQRDAFEKANVPEGADGQVSSVARRFALIASAGELGIAFSVLPWPKGEAIRAAQASFKAWLNARGNAGAGEDTAALAAVRRFIEMHDESRFTTIFPNGERMTPDTDGDMQVASGRSTNNRVGFRRKGTDGWEYLIFPEAWKNEVCTGLDHVRAANVLIAAGHMKAGEGRHLMPKVEIANYGRKRYYLVKNSILDASDE